MIPGAQPLRRPEAQGFAGAFRFEGEGAEQIRHLRAPDSPMECHGPQMVPVEPAR